MINENYGIIKITAANQFSIVLRSEDACYAKSASDSSICSGNGVCKNGKCLCENNFSGIQCEFTTCFGKNSTASFICSGNGICKDKDICTCNEGFGGKECEFNYQFNSNTIIYSNGRNNVTFPKI